MSFRKEPPDTPSDPAGWNAAHTDHTAVDELEPETFEPNTYREASRHFLRVVLCIDSFLAGSRDARVASIQLALALGLPSVQGRTVTAVAEELGVTKQALSRGVARFLRMSHLDPAFGLKSPEARRTYQVTNGIRCEG